MKKSANALFDELDRNGQSEENVHAINKLSSPARLVKYVAEFIPCSKNEQGKKDAKIGQCYKCFNEGTRATLFMRSFDSMLLEGMSKARLEKSQEALCQKRQVVFLGSGEGSTVQ